MVRCALLAFLTVCMTAVSGCTALQPTAATPEELRDLIRSGEVLEPGQRVRLVTSDEAEHEFRVEAIDLENGFVLGKNDSVRLDDIVAVETRRISAGRTALLTGGLAYGIGVVIAIAIAPALILGGS